MKVTQWLDGSIYRDYVEVAVPGAELTALDGRVFARGAIGGWVEDETAWIADAGTLADSVVITGARNGTLIDQISIEVLTSVVEAEPALLIRQLAGATSRVQLSWVSAVGGWLLESSGDLTNTQGWQPVQESITVVGEQHTVAVDADAAARFFRLRKP